MSIDATRLTLAKAPQVSDAPAESAAPPLPLEPVQVVFSSPTDGETDVAATGAIRIQFSRGLNEPSLAGRLRVSYVGAAAPDAGLPFQTTYDGANRAIVLRMAKPLEAFRTVKVEILDGLKAFDGAPITPWTISFSVGRMIAGRSSGNDFEFRDAFLLSPASPRPRSLPRQTATAAHRSRSTGRHQTDPRAR